MRYKDGVKVQGMQPEAIAAQHVVAAVYAKYGQMLVVTSVMDGKHKRKSAHDNGYAFDCRTRFFRTIGIVRAVADDIRERLTDEYDVIVETTHIHVEFDPK